MVDGYFQSENIRKARMVAHILHCTAKYGDFDYMKHLDDVYSVLRRFDYDNENQGMAAYLHDTVEDTQMKLSVIELYFGESVADIVETCTNELGKNRAARNLKNYPKLQNHPFGLAVKLADRIANVENAIATKSTKYQMYKKEYPGFRKALRDRINHVKMWAHLDRLFKFK